MNVSEEFLHYIWKNNLFENENFVDSDNNIIEVIDNGTHNQDSGPDFFNAKIKINETLWAGNIEIHINSSDWLKHGHHNNKAYDNVILHLVLNNDKDIYRTDGSKIQTAEITFDSKIHDRYKYLVNTKQALACSSFINEIDKFTVNSWLTVVLYQRLEEKTDYLKEILIQSKNNWEQTFYITISRAFGFKVNAQPFEMLAKSLDIKILGKHKNNLFQIEALLFGQAGLLNENIEHDEYYKSLKKEYNFLRTKYSLTPMPAHLWKFMRMRPANFPTIRISQFAQLIKNSVHLFSKTVNSQSIDELLSLFKLSASEYWNTHYTFGKETKFRQKETGKETINNILINTIIPILFLYGKHQDNQHIIEKSLMYLENLQAENNSITKEWEQINFKIENAFFSQAVIGLNKNYCSKRRCLFCRIGNKII